MSSMAEISFKDLRDAIQIHEINSIIVPGVVFLYGLNLIYSQLGSFTSGDLSIGSIIVFLFLAYGAGYLIQSIGNLIELYIVIPIFGDLRKREAKKTVSEDKITIFKNCKKLCRGTAAALLFLLGFALINGTFDPASIYSILLLLSSIVLFWYMRRFNRRELGI